MNKQTEALKMAKDMLLELNGHKLVTPDGHIVIDTSKQIKACKEALKQPTQEAIEHLQFVASYFYDGETRNLGVVDACEKAINKITGKEIYKHSVLEQPTPQKNHTSLADFIAELEKDQDFKELMNQKRAELLALLEIEQPTQEPVAWMNDVAFSEHKELLQDVNGEIIPLYTHPAPSWQGLSDDEVKIIQGGFCKGQYYVPDLVRAIEQALKEKNDR